VVFGRCVFLECVYVLARSAASVQTPLFVGSFLLIFGVLSQSLGRVFSQQTSVSSEDVTVHKPEVGVQQRLPRQPQELSEDMASNSYFKDQPLYFFDLARRRKVIKGKTFEDCDIYGPAVIAIMKGCDFIECHFAEAASRNALVWPVAPDRPDHIGAIGLEECIF